MEFTTSARGPHFLFLLEALTSVGHLRQRMTKINIHQQGLQDANKSSTIATVCVHVCVQIVLVTLLLT